MQILGHITKREWYAVMAMQGLCANQIPGSHHIPANLAKEALACADALLNELGLSDAKNCESK